MTAPTMATTTTPLASAFNGVLPQRNFGLANFTPCARRSSATSSSTQCPLNGISSLSGNRVGHHGSHEDVMIISTVSGGGSVQTLSGLALAALHGLIDSMNMARLGNSPQMWGNTHVWDLEQENQALKIQLAQQKLASQDIVFQATMKKAQLQVKIEAEWQDAEFQ